MTFRTANLTCETCGEGFQVQIGTSSKGVELPHFTICRVCRSKADFQEQLAQKRLQLVTLNAETRLSYIKQSGLRTKFQTYTFENFDKTKQTKAFEAMLGFDGKTSIILSSANGVYGLGKTHLCAALINKRLEDISLVILDERDLGIRFRMEPTKFVDEMSLIARIKATFNSALTPDDEDYETEENIYQELLRVPLLIIDDVGKLVPRDLSFLQGVYYRLIDGRYGEDKPVIITTNLDSVALENHIGGACADRLREMCGKTGFVKMTGTSYRKR